ncbi:MAG: esterase-like activity of phytase family protein [Rhodocyclaceae bacterium]
MNRFKIAALSLALQGALPAAYAEVNLIAIGSVNGAYEDLAWESATPLENGVAGNRLGGLGSGLAYAGGNTFLALPDRGPNATAYDAAIDNTTSYIPRFQTLSLSLAPSEAGAPLPFVLTPMLRDTTLLHSRTRLAYAPGGAPALNAESRRYYFSGRSDNFDGRRSSLNPNNGRLDPEGIRVSPNGATVFISDEYGPYVYQFDRRSGQRLRAFKLPESFGAAKLSAVGDSEIAANTSGRVANKGMEGLAISPDGSTLYGIMQSPLLQDGGTSAPYVRIVRIDVASGAVRQYAYELTNTGTAAKPKYGSVSEILAVNDHEFLVDERDGKGLGDDSAAGFKRLYHIDLDGAAEVSHLSGAANLAGKAVGKNLFLDLVAAFNAAGIASVDIPAKIEGMAFGPSVTQAGRTRHTLFIANDNDFLPTVTDGDHPQGADNPNKFFVFAFDGEDLPNLLLPQIARFESCGDRRGGRDEEFDGSR